MGLIGSKYVNTAVYRVAPQDGLRLLYYCLRVAWILLAGETKVAPKKQR